MSTLEHLNNVRVVLVNTSHPGNIGAVARAMKNMGLRKLTLVSPEDFPSQVATSRAVSAADILESATVVDTLEEAIADSGLVIAASARSRSMPWPMLTPPECAQQVVRDAPANQVALVFGREDRGLTNEELTLCNYHVQIPSDPECSALNLAAAVTVILYELRMTCLDQQRAAVGAPFFEEDEYWDVSKADGHQMELFYEHLEKVLIDIDFHDPEHPRLLMTRMRRLFGRIRPDTMEVNILRGILTQVERASGQKDHKNSGHKKPGHKHSGPK